MTPLPDAAVSMTERVKPVAVGGAATAIHFMRGGAAFITGEETVLLVSPDGSERRVQAHQGGILAAAGDDRRVITAGDDGRVVATGADGKTNVLAVDPRGRWIDRLALTADGSVAWGTGKTAFVRTAAGQEKSLDLPSGIGGLAFSPKGFRLAISHYNGVTLWFPNAGAEPELLEWKGSHIGVMFSPDGKFIVTTMQEPVLHGWRVADRKHMRMSGYSAKVRSFDWTVGGKWLATAGSEQLILWPFQGKDGPMGKQPRMLSPRELRAVVVASSPTNEVVAVGYADGMVLLVRIEDGAEILVRRPSGAPVTALAWSKVSDHFAYGTEDGDGGVLAL